MIDINLQIQRLIQYGKKKNFLKTRDEIYARNKILKSLNILEFQEKDVFFAENDNLSDILRNIVLWAESIGILKNKSIKESDRLVANLIDCIMPKPSEIEEEFLKKYKDSPFSATNYFYNLSIDSYYIKMDRLKKNVKWKFFSEYGNLDITINLAKPEKDPKEISRAKKSINKSYSKCFLCREAEGYEVHENFPERLNHRLIEISLCNEKWFLQYSPYMYYDEHCIILKDKHEEMSLSKKTFEKLFEFVDKFPHYFIGSNADLPIVGGSILSHDHFQGGRYEFPMAAAKIKKRIYLKDFPDIDMGILKWPMATLRLSGVSKENILKVSGIVLETWRNYKDEEADIFPLTGGLNHNTITPIARRRGKIYEIDLILRNNRTTDLYPYGVFHPHENLHHIKKENIGLIEAMGLAVLPGRLYKEISLLKECLKDGIEDISEIREISIHRDWYDEIMEKYKNGFEADQLFRNEVGDKFRRVLWDASVFKDNDQGMACLMKFVNAVLDNIN